MSNGSVKVTLLGGLTTEQGADLLTGRLNRKAELLFAYLVVERRTHSREALATLFWEESTQKQALSNLRTLLSRLGRYLGDYVQVTQHTVALDNAAQVWTDVGQFEQQIATAEDDPAALAAALALYHSDFLEGVDLGGSHRLEEWAAITRERLRRQARRARHTLAEHYLHTRNYRAGIDQAQALVTMDPLHEGARRLLMRLLARAGRQNEALQQYEQCRRLLAEELAVEPAAETTALYHRIRSAKLPPPHRLPLQGTPFVGREGERATIQQRLDDPHCRLLTILGPGGAGKTRLALQAADERRGDYLHGIIFVNLAPLKSAAQLPDAIAAAMGQVLQGKAAPEAQLFDLLSERELLLLLDNVEHLLGPDPERGAAGFIQRLLPAAPGVSLLVTSRERLHLRAEWLLPLAGLPYAGEEKEAEHLFALCAHRLLPHFSATGEAAAAVSDLCRLVEGLPLAIELAAASLAPGASPAQLAQMVERIGQNMDLLAVEMADMPPRHRSLRAAFDHSWRLLAEKPRQALARLSVFQGSFGAPAAAAVAGTGDAMLQTLVDKSLLRQEGAERFALHEVIRDYAGERLAGEERARAHERHRAYYTGLLARQAPLLGGPEQAPALARIGREADNVRLAWTRAAAAGDTPALERALPGLFAFYKTRGQMHSGADLFGQAVALLDGRPPAREIAARLRTTHGWFLTEIGSYPQAAAQLEQALATLDEGSRPAVRAAALHNLGEVRRLQGEYRQAGKLFGEARTLYEQAGDPAGLGQVWHSLGNLALRQGALREARQRYREALALRRQHGDLVDVGGTLINLGLVHLRLGEMAAAREHFEQALALVDRYGIDFYRARLLNNLGLINDVTGHFRTSLDLYRRSLALHREQGHPYGLANAEYNTGWAHFCLGEYEAAEQVLQANLQMTRRRDLAYHQAFALIGLGLCALETGRLEQAEERLQAAHAIREELGDRRGVAWTLHHLGRLALAQNRLEQAGERLEASLAIFRDVAEQWGILATLALQGRALVATGRLEAAHAALQESIRLALPLDGHPFLAEAALGLAALRWQQGRHAEAAALWTQLTRFEHCQQFVRDRAQARLLAWKGEPPAGDQDLLETLRSFA